MSAQPNVPDLGVSARELFERLEDAFTGTDDPYHQLYQQTMEAQLAADNAVESRRLMPLLDEIDDFNSVERAIRSAGFVLGFEVCRQLLHTTTADLVLRAGRLSAGPQPRTPREKRIYEHVRQLLAQGSSFAEVLQDHLDDIAKFEELASPAPTPPNEPAQRRQRRAGQASRSRRASHAQAR